MTFVSTGPDLVSGGVFGPEAGIGATAGTLVVLVLLSKYFRRRGAPDLPLPFRAEEARRSAAIGDWRTFLTLFGWADAATPAGIDQKRQ